MSNGNVSGQINCVLNTMCEYFLRNHFLIATPGLKDPHFRRAVTYIYQHDETGALGIIVNKPIKITLGEVLQHIGVATTNTNVSNHTVMLGGPIAREQGFIIFPKEKALGEEEPPLITTEDIAVSTSKSVLQKIATAEQTSDLIVALGYASWAPGQLERELLGNTWLVAPYKRDLLFNTPYPERWKSAAKIIGVNLDWLSYQAGHA